MAVTVKIIRSAGKWGIRNWNGMCEFFSFVKSVFVSMTHYREVKLRSLYVTIVNQVFFTGVNALWIVLAISVTLGATVIIQSMKNFPKFGIDEFVGNLLVIIIARELGPLATAMIVVSRSGSAIATEIATQKQNHEIRSLELMGIDTKLYIVVPRIIASIIAIFSLIVIFDITAFFGGYLVAISSVYIPIGQFSAGLIQAFSANDLLLTVIKSVTYGFLIPVICCFYGFAPRSSFEIPIFVSKAVVRSLLILFLINAVLSVLFYL
jgi:phospholipid/cholesterol/gamma-HCH transport system permease protein